MYRWKSVPLGRVPLGRVLVGVSAALLVAAAGSVVLGRGSRPDAVTTAVTACGLDVPGAAQVTYRLTNRDRTWHGYRVHVSVIDGHGVLGSGTSLLGHVAAGATSEAKALVPLSARTGGALCEVHAEVFDADTGHHTPD